MSSVTLTSSAENSCNNSCSHWLCCLCTKKKNRSPVSESQTTIRVEKIYKRSHRHGRNGGSSRNCAPSHQFDNSELFAKIHLGDRRNANKDPNPSNPLNAAQATEKGSPKSQLGPVLLSRRESTNNEKAVGATSDQTRAKAPQFNLPDAVMSPDDERLIWV